MAYPLGSHRPARWRVAVCGACLILTAVVSTHAQRAAEPDQVSRRVRVRDLGADPNVAVASEVNVRPRETAPPRPSPPAPAPNPAPAGPQCAVTFDNRTNLIAKTYIDGRYSGSIAAFGAMSTSITAGATVLYARAEFDDGSADAWGPVRVSCRTKYVWRLAD